MDRRAWIFFILIILILGTMIMISAEITVSIKFSGDPSKAFVKVAVKLVLGFILVLIFSIFHYSLHEELSTIYYFLSLILLGGVFFFGGKVHRWIEIGFFSFQPSEFAKIATILTLARYLKERKESLGSFKEGVLKPLLIASIPAFLIFIEPDLSTAILIVALALLMIYSAGAKLLHVGGVMICGGLALMGAYFLGVIKTYQIERLKSFLQHNMQDQVLMAIQSAKSGGILGKGLALGEMKLSVPVSQSDFIFSIIGEELGYLGIVVILISYLGLVWSLIKLAEREVLDDFAKFYVYGYSYLIVLQVTINLGVNVGILPITGVTLPFISHGGSSYLAFMMGLGIVVSVFFSKEREEEV